MFGGLSVVRVINFTGDTWVSRLEDGSPDEDLLRIADALGRLAHEGRPGSTVYVGYDTRSLSVALAAEVGEVIAAHGVRALVSDAHCPMPALSEAVRRNPAAFGGIMLTAGNRPADYVGARVRMADGSAATPADTDVLEALIVPEPPTRRGEAERVDIVTPLLERISAFADGQAVAESSPLVVCDPMHGATSSHARRLLSALGARTIEIHDGDEEDFGGLHPEVVEPWIDDCEQAVVDNGAAYGFALDGAGDRLALVDDRGRLVSPHKMLALIMEYLVRGRSMTGRMVAPIFVSSIVRRQAERLGLPLTVTPAGYVWMREEMAAGDVVCAGDALGGITIPAVGLERDPLVVAALVAELVAADGRPLSAISDDLEREVGHMEYARRDVRMGSGDIQMLRNILPGLNPASVAGRTPVSVSHSAGSLRLAFDDDSWLLVRPSRTLPAARVYAEAPTPALRDGLLDAGSRLACSPLAGE